jgi:hypothetical protein
MHGPFLVFILLELSRHIVLYLILKSHYTATLYIRSVLQLPQHSGLSTKGAHLYTEPLPSFLSSLFLYATESGSTSILESGSEQSSQNLVHGCSANSRQALTNGALKEDTGLSCSIEAVLAPRQRFRMVFL